MPQYVLTPRQWEQFCDECAEMRCYGGSRAADVTALRKAKSIEIYLLGQKIKVIRGK